MKIPTACTNLSAPHAESARAGRTVNLIAAVRPTFICVPRNACDNAHQHTGT